MPCSLPLGLLRPLTCDHTRRSLIFSHVSLAIITHRAAFFSDVPRAPLFLDMLSEHALVFEKKVVCEISNII